MMKNKLKALSCKLFGWAKNKGYEHLIYPGAPLVKTIDFLFQSECKYCMSLRAMVFGFGLALTNWLGLALILAAVGLTVFERFCKAT
jgi:hypothetical protein